MQQHELFEFLLDTFSELATLHASAAATAQRAWSVLAKLEEVDLRGVLCGDLNSGCLPQDRLMVNPTTFTVEWHGRRCNLGPTILFKLIQRLARRPDRHFSYDILMEDVWQQRCSDATIRSAVKRLRRAMRDADMSELANAIRGRGKCYGVFLGGGYP